MLCSDFFADFFFRRNLVQKIITVSPHLTVAISPIVAMYSTVAMYSIVAMYSTVAIYSAPPSLPPQTGANSRLWRRSRREAMEKSKTASPILTAKPPTIEGLVWGKV
jgi:hypothetical protein